MVNSTRLDLVRLIVADDLTGAADACAKLVVHGFSGLVVPDLDRAPPPALLEQADVVAVSLDTRRRPSAATPDRVRRAFDVTGRGAECAAFAKIDSTLRGHVGVQIQSVLATLGCTHAIMTPAFPAMGRTVRDGLLVVDDAGATQPIDVCALLATQGLEGAVPLATTSGDDAVDALRGAMERACADGASVLVCDATCDEDLQTIVAAGQAVPSRPLWVGSAGLAEALGAHLDAGTGGRRARPRPEGRRIGRVLLCLGSPHPVTQAQQVRLLAERPVTTLDASSYESINHVVGAAGPLLLPITSATPEDLSATLAIVTAGELAGVVLSGGDTATDVCAALGADAIEPGGEVASGMPWGILHGGRASGLPVVLKAGSFGADDALVRAVDFLSMNDGPDAER